MLFFVLLAVMRQLATIEMVPYRGSSSVNPLRIVCMKDRIADDVGMAPTTKMYHCPMCGRRHAHLEYVNIYLDGVIDGVLLDEVIVGFTVEQQRVIRSIFS